MVLPCLDSSFKVSITDVAVKESNPVVHHVDETYQHVAAGEEFSNFCEAVRILPVQCRKVFVLKKVYGYSQREIAIELEISESTVEKHIALGMKRCINFMNKLSLLESPQKNKSGSPVFKIISSGDRS